VGRLDVARIGSRSLALTQRSAHTRPSLPRERFASALSPSKHWAEFRGSRLPNQGVFSVDGGIVAPVRRAVQRRVRPAGAGGSRWAATGGKRPGRGSTWPVPTRSTATFFGSKRRVGLAPAEIRA
jgi:hypothetical protein